MNTLSSAACGAILSALTAQLAELRTMRQTMFEAGSAKADLDYWDRALADTKAAYDEVLMLDTRRFGTGKGGV